MQYGIELRNKLTFQIKWEWGKVLTKEEKEMIPKEEMQAQLMEMRTIITIKIRNSRKTEEEVNIMNTKQLLMELK
jgi:hypothetical protein